MADEKRKRNATRRRSRDRRTSTPYNKMIRHEVTGTAEGSGIPEQTNAAVGGGNRKSGAIPSGAETQGSSTGGINTSDSVVSGGSTAGGTNIGQGATTDRGRMNDAPDLSMNSAPVKGMGSLRADAEAHNPPRRRRSTQGKVETDGEVAPGTHPRKNPSPLSREEAEKINRDARSSSNVPLSKDSGHDPQL